MSKVPACIGIIMDGNRRWARERGLPTLEGHRRGFEKVKDVCVWAKDAGVGTLVLYAFSTENWNRSKEEVSYLMDLFKELTTTELEEAKERGYRVRFIGQRERFSQELIDGMGRVEKETKDGEALTLVVALSYGGRAEILDAVNKLCAEGVRDVTEETLRRMMWSAEVPDPDLIMRPGGEKRLSNFLTWGSVYSELLFVDTYWPAFTKEDFDAAVEEYAARERRRGK